MSSKKDIRKSARECKLLLLFSLLRTVKELNLPTLSVNVNKSTIMNGSFFLRRAENFP